jgi:hypothetical protein
MSKAKKLAYAEKQKAAADAAAVRFLPVAPAAPAKPEKAKSRKQSRGK